jgi:hypothetical protein
MEVSGQNTAVKRKNYCPCQKSKPGHLDNSNYNEYKQSGIMNST